MNAELPILDIHMHLAALDPADTGGGWFAPGRINSLVFRTLRRFAGLPVENRNFDAGFRRVVTQMVNDASELARTNGFAGFFATGLAFDWSHLPDGKPDTSNSDFHVPDSYAHRVAEEANSQKPVMIAAASIHPYREDAIERLDGAIQKGAAAVKWLPTSQNIDPSDSRSVAFARHCAATGMPLLVHTGSEEATRNVNPQWNDPRALEPLLATGASVIAAHMGMYILRPSWFRHWVEMLPHWPNLYGDTSAMFEFRPYRLSRVLDRRPVAERLVHGSDWPVPVWPLWYWPGISAGTAARLWKIKNPLWRDAATKMAAGFPRECFTRAWSLLNKKAVEAAGVNI